MNTKKRLIIKTIKLVLFLKTSTVGTFKLLCHCLKPSYCGQQRQLRFAYLRITNMKKKLTFENDKIGTLSENLYNWDIQTVLVQPC